MLPYERLSAQDEAFLHMERAGAPMHVGSVATFEGAPFSDGAGRFRIEEVRDLIESRLHLVPRFLRKLRWVPFGLGRPVWVDDPSFDISYHVRLTALPHPGGEEELKVLVARVISQPLDRSKPLWELWFVQGLIGDRVALIEKTHHCLVDGASSLARWKVLLDPTREPVHPAVPPWRARPAPSSTNLAVRSLAELAAEPMGLARTVGSILRSPRSTLHHTGELAAALSPIAHQSPLAPPSSLNRPIGLHRKVDWVGVPMEEMADTRRRLGCTVNDLVLAVATGGLRRLLRSRGEELEGKALRAFVPVSVRDPADPSPAGNRVSAILVPLPVGEADPVARLRAVQASVEDLKRRHEATGVEFVMGLTEHALPSMLGLGGWLVNRERLVNLTVTNVPGPRDPFFCLGARLLEWFAFVPLTAYQSVGVCVLSYAGQLGFGLNADRDACEDVAVLAEALAKSFVEIRDAPADGERPVGKLPEAAIPR